MIIDSFDVYSYALDLSQPLTLHGQTLQKREGLILHLKSNSGAEGFGEVAPLPGFSKETLHQAQTQVGTLQENLCGQEISWKLANLDGAFDAWLDGPALKSSVRFGLESAILNLMANAKNIPLHKLISKSIRAKVKITGLLSGPQEQITRQAKELIAGGYTELKLKVGANLEEAIEKVRAVNDIVYGKALLHLDVNQAWTYEQAVGFGKQIGCDAVNYIEEPFKDIQRIPEFFDETLIPVALDETLQRLPFDDIKGLSGVDILVLKPTLLGGLEKTWQIIDRAEDFALDAVVSSSFESSIGIWALANLAGMTSHSGICAGLDTLKWFKNDVFSQPLSPLKGEIDISERIIESKDIDFSVLRKI